MNTYFIPKQNKTPQEYQEYCSGLPFVYAGEKTLSIDPAREYVSVNGTITGFDQITLPAQPLPPVILTKLQFLDRFTNTELATILTVAKTEPMVEVFVKKLDLADSVDLTSARTIEGVNALEQFGLINAGRANEILTT